MSARIGQALDAHRLVPGRRLVLGGVEVPHDCGLEGHSDGDALLHAVADAILGALGQGDLGRHFPSSDPSLAGIDSRHILERVRQMMSEAGYRLANLDATIIAQAPRLAPHQQKMRAQIAALLGASEDRVNLKVTSTDGLGALGREEGIAALAVVLLESKADDPGDGPALGSVDRSGTR
jgi:2-C-methyl-D-erythritol 2,4-cyclodiphosphate synthase